MCKGHLVECRNNHELIVKENDWRDGMRCPECDAGLRLKRPVDIDKINGIRVYNPYLHIKPPVKNNNFTINITVNDNPKDTAKEVFREVVKAIENATKTM